MSDAGDHAKRIRAGARTEREARAHMRQPAYDFNLALKNHLQSGAPGKSRLVGKRARKAARSSRPKTDAKNALGTFRGMRW